MNKAIVEYLSLETCIKKLEEAVKVVELSFLVENIERLKQLVTERVLVII